MPRWARYRALLIIVSIVLFCHLLVLTFFILQRLFSKKTNKEVPNSTIDGACASLFVLRNSIILPGVSTPLADIILDLENV